jgi:D-aspartate ligase
MTASRPSAMEPHDPVEPGTDGRPVPVLVLRRSLSHLQHCALAVARTMGRLGVPVYSVRQSRTEPSTMSRYIKGALDLSADATEAEWVEQLMGLGQHLTGGILLPIDDVSAVSVGDHREVLSSRFRVPQQPLGVPRRLASKLELASVCRELDVPTPETTLLNSPEEAVQFTERFGYPVVLKRSVAWGGAEDPEGPSVLIVHGPAELRPAYDRIRIQSPDAPNVIAQEYIPGSSESVWIFNGYFDRESRCLSAFTGQKIRQCAHGAGQTTLGICVHNQTVVDLSIRLLEGVQYRGIVDMGFRFDARDGQYKLLDVNPRLGSTFRLFSAPDGADVVRAMYLDLTGRPVPPAAAMPGRTWRDEPHDVVAAMRLVRTRELSLGAWARSLARTTERAWWAKDDPVPFFAMAASLPREVLAQRTAGRPARRAGHRS